MFEATLSGRRQSNGTPVRTNIRADKSTDSAILGELPPYPDFVNGFAARADTVVTNGYVWRAIQVQAEDDTTISGFVADSLVQVEEIITLPDAKLFFDIEGATFHMTQAAWDTFCVDFATVAAILPTVQGRE